MSTRVALSGVLAAGDPLEHPATTAWLSLDPSHGPPTAITILKSSHKSGVYRLHAVSPGNAVVAKRARRETAAVERLIHEDVLPSLPLSRLDFFGAVDEGPEGRMWLFMQDAGDRTFASDQHILVAQWLAELHTTAADSAGFRAANLPDRGLAHYRAGLDHSRERLRALIPQWSAPDRADARAILEQNLALLDRLDARWARFAGSAGVLPPTLAHGDFVPKNVRLGGRSAAPAVYVLDWETAGWGSPEVDLAGFKPAAAELDAYASAVRRRWPAIDAAAIEQARRVGVVMRWIVAMDWATNSLGWGWDAAPLRKLECYAISLRSALGRSEGVGVL